MCDRLPLMDSTDDCTGIMIVFENCEDEDHWYGDFKYSLPLARLFADIDYQYVMKI